GRELLGPEEREVEVAAAVVDLTHPTGRRLVLLQESAGGTVEGLGEDECLAVPAALPEVAEGLGQREELTEAVPAQVVLRNELLDVLRRRTAGAGLEEAATVHERDDREHLRARAELEDGEQ